jgi:hypothetical protein
MSIDFLLFNKEVSFYSNNQRLSTHQLTFGEIEKRFNFLLEYRQGNFQFNVCHYNLVLE